MGNEANLAWMILTLVFILGRDQLYAIELLIPPSQRQPFLQKNIAIIRTLCIQQVRPSKIILLSPQNYSRNTIARS
jgi:hypothetical protein